MNMGVATTDKLSRMTLWSRILAWWHELDLVWKIVLGAYVAVKVSFVAISLMDESYLSASVASVTMVLFLSLVWILNK